MLEQTCSEIRVGAQLMLSLHLEGCVAHVAACVNRPPLLHENHCR